MRVHVAVAVIVGGVVVACPGCGGKTAPEPSAEVTRKNFLTDVFDGYSTFLKNKSRTPKDAKEFLAFIETTNPSASIILKDGGTCVLLYGGGMGGDPNTVLAYEKTVSASSGMVLMQNGAVKEMTAAEFASAPKVGETKTETKATEEKK